jgi:hypothetical protein
VDGVVFLVSEESGFEPVEVSPGEMVEVKITGALDYDLMGEIIYAEKRPGKRKKTTTRLSETSL